MRAYSIQMIETWGFNGGITGGKSDKAVGVPPSERGLDREELKCRPSSLQIQWQKRKLILPAEELNVRISSHLLVLAHSHLYCGVTIKSKVIWRPAIPNPVEHARQKERGQNGDIGCNFEAAEAQLRILSEAYEIG